ncbi:carbonate dehydratase [Bacillus sp. HMF5848]|uniref:carbonic anhydrase n=1 Tax=Bacillus sp. HMF5848 TaxID=2495421 RepID=UPI000F79B857|nr:carbonic anhydrase family protein [Bacillus sp. HMF5848]RSK26291.1 carbonate dehydratase [Bacillus sp. HMF5848]
MYRKVLITIILCICFSKSAIAKKDWSYSGETGPEYWSQIKPAYTLCAEGHKQSPVNFNNPTFSPSLPFTYHYIPSYYNIQRRDYTFEVGISSDEHFNYVLIDDSKYFLKQIHFNAPSEHTINGNFHPMEAHFIHQNSEKEYAILSIFFTLGDSHRLLKKIWESNEKTGIVVLKINDFFPEHLNNIAYVGSLTTPPCTENVKWYVFEEPLQLSTKQLDYYRGIFPQNNRPIQRQLP